MPRLRREGVAGGRADALGLEGEKRAGALKEVVQPAAAPQPSRQRAQPPSAGRLRTVRARLQQMHVDLVEALVADVGGELAGEPPRVVQVELAADEALIEPRRERGEIA